MQLGVGCYWIYIKFIGSNKFSQLQLRDSIPEYYIYQILLNPFDCSKATPMPIKVLLLWLLTWTWTEEEYGTKIHAKAAKDAHH